MGATLSARAGAYGVAQNAEINVTPFVDVMLVLLIIFMVAIPASTVSVKVDLPTAVAGDAGARPVIVTLARDGGVYVGDRRTTLAGLPDLVKASIGAPAGQRIHLRADKGVTYGTLMAVMNSLRAGGYDKVGLVGEEL